MMALAAEVLTLWSEALYAGFVVFLRIGGMVAVLPVFGERTLTQRVRIAVAVTLTVLVTPIVFETLPTDGVPGRAFLTEPINGLIMGLGIRFFIFALQIAGEIAAQAASLSQIFGGTADAQPAFGHLMVIGGLALMTLAGLHVKVLEYTLLFYDLLPPLVLPDAMRLAEWGIEQTARAFALAFTLAAPFVIASLIYNMALGAINRAMPQLMVAFVGAPAISGGGLFVLFLILPGIFVAWYAALERFLANPQGSGL